MAGHSRRKTSEHQVPIPETSVYTMSDLLSVSGVAVGADAEKCTAAVPVQK